MSLLGDLAGAALGSAMGGNNNQGGDMLGGLMGLLGGGAAGGGNNQMLNMAMQLVQSYPGGVGGLMQAFQNGGLGEVASSWVGTGANAAISGDQLTNALGGDQLGALAQQFGMSQGDAASGLASMLPELMNGLTPNGAVDNDLIQQGLGMLAGKLLG
jgi:uncharacterized protein YidB (DUF937 family)